MHENRLRRVDALFMCSIKVINGQLVTTHNPGTYIHLAKLLSITCVQLWYS